MTRDRIVVGEPFRPGGELSLDPEFTPYILALSLGLVVIVPTMQRLSTRSFRRSVSMRSVLLLLAVASLGLAGGLAAAVGVVVTEQDNVETMLVLVATLYYLFGVMSLTRLYRARRRQEQRAARERQTDR